MAVPCKLLTATSVVILAVLFGCKSDPTARDAWAKGLALCAQDDILESKDVLLYLGPSNVYGPGSGWRVTKSGNFESMWPLDAAIPDPETRRRLIVTGREADCSVARDKTWSIAPELLFSAATIPADAEARADFSLAQHTVVQVARWRKDTLNEIEYEDWMLDPDSGRYARDLLENRPKRRVMKSAVLVMGFSADLIYSGESAASIKAKYPLNTEVSVGGGLSVKRTSETTLSLNAAEPFYIIGTLLPFEQHGFGMTPSRGERLLQRSPQTIRSDARALPPAE